MIKFKTSTKKRKNLIQKRNSERVKQTRSADKYVKFTTYLKNFCLLYWAGVCCGKKFFWILKFCFSSAKLPESHFSFSKNEKLLLFIIHQVLDKVANVPQDIPISAQQHLFSHKPYQVLPLCKKLYKIIPF